MPSPDLRIVALGLGAKAASLLEAGMSPNDVVSTLNREDAETIREAEMLDLTVRDVRDFQDFLREMEASEVQALVRGSADEKRTAARVQERIEKTLNLMEMVESVSKDVMEDFRSGRQVWGTGKPVEVVSDNGAVKLVYPPYPTKQLNALLKILGESRALIGTLVQDKAAQSFIKNAVINTGPSGMPLSELYQVIRNMATILDVPMDRMMSAFTEAQDMQSARPRYIDADAVTQE